MLSRRRDDDAGSISLVAIGFAIVGVLLLAVVIGGSQVFLTKRDLAGAADTAAAAAAQAVAEPVVYGGATGPLLPIDPAGAESIVLDYVQRAGLGSSFEEFVVLDVTVSSATVTVTFGARAPVPLGGMLSDEWAAGVPITATASARSPFS